MSQLLKITTLIYGFIIPCIPAFSQAPLQQKRLYISFAPLLSVENFRWSIAGNEQGTNPDILSELNFTGLKRTGFFMQGCYQMSKRLGLEATATMQYGYSGRVTDIDYAGNNRSRVVTFLKFRSRKNNGYDYRLQGHYQLLQGGVVSVAARAGYFISKAGYRMQGRSAADIKGIYNVQWQGPLLGVDAKMTLPQHWEVRAAISGQYHTYYAEADWRLRSDFKHPLSFVHRAKGGGINGQLGLHYQLNAQVGLQLKGFLQQWQTGTGSDQLYMADDRQVSTRMNESVKTQLGAALEAVFGF
ncbi:hypothetical protein LQ567_25670 [Niabella pedocola]|uniref:Protochlamydia outer membrane protein domain-containing protein n=1 Tax=Niabella pedocola TaxID=1752077 RepID=A0ABS8PYS9_9BACT|nr:hypothetical protein [Niabella pedocola]MCD2426200.1 hypothetical protein [Niabella pedocola]